MPQRDQRGMRINPNILPIKGSTAAPEAPGERGVAQDVGQANHQGSRERRSADVAGVENAARMGGAVTAPSTFAKKRPYVND
jgi:hypothetical protein